MGKVISVKRGFSFTYLFFGPFVPLLRGHIAGFFLSLFLTFCSCGIAHFILLFCYNGMYINWLVKHGYVRVYREAEEKTKPEAESGEKANPAAVVWSKFAGRKEEEDKTEPLFRPLRGGGPGGRGDARAWNKRGNVRARAVRAACPGCFPGRGLDGGEYYLEDGTDKG